ncbi:MAG: hypothetical protein H7X97_10730, partial [Opitutaceae bacterium]|nr:hypothetical protein [Verrucomicrobiales bacterium]
AATYADKIARLQLLSEAKSPAYNAWRIALDEDAKKSSAHAFALGRWMILVEGPTNTLRWLQALPVAVQTNQPVPLLVTDCQIALKNWNGLLATVLKQDWGEANFYRLALESLAQRGLNQALPAKNAWQKSFRIAASRLDRLARLAQMTSTWSWRAEGVEVLEEIVDKFPKEKWAADQLMASLYADGNTRALSDLLVKLHSADPTDNRNKNNLASISLLRKSNLENAHKMAKEAFNSDPKNPVFISTYAYSLLLQNKPDEAVKALDGMKADYLKDPSIALYFGVVQAQAGHKDVAKEPLKLAETARLLPEEKEIVRLAKARM